MKNKTICPVVEVPLICSKEVTIKIYTWNLITGLQYCLIEFCFKRVSGCCTYENVIIFSDLKIVHFILFSNKRSQSE